MSSVSVLGRGDRDYPALLAAVYDPPPCLYVRGAMPGALVGPCVAVVGARACSAYGRQVARLLGRELAAAGAVVVSGLARGVDAEAHRGALDAGGPTVAVLGCGIDRVYPSGHAELAARILERGLIVSEYGAGVEPAPWRFPARNRIVAGLSRAVVVVEARERSGALITADFAMEEGRDVLAVPGEITSSLSAGTNNLLRQGAAPLLCAADVLDVLGLDRPAPVVAAASPAGAAVLEALARGPGDVDGIAARCGLPAAAVAAALTELELDRRVAGESGIYRPLGLVERGAAAGDGGGGGGEAQGTVGDGGLPVV